MNRALAITFTVTLAAGSALAADVVELLGQPCRAKQVLGACVVKDRQDGRERLVLLNDNETCGCELLYIDFEKDRGEVFAAPAGAGSWTGIEVPGDRLVVGTFYDGTFMIFDLAARKFIKSIKFPGESYIWNLTIGSDGRVYGGTYPGGKLGAISLDTYAFADLGGPAKPNQYLRNVSATPWGQIVANFGMEKPTSKVYDITSKAWKEIPGLSGDAQFGVGVIWNGTFVAHDPRSGRLQAFEDASWEPSKKSVLAAPEAGKYSLDTQLTATSCLGAGWNTKTLYLRLGTAVYSLRADQRTFAPTKVADVDLRGGRFVGVTASGELLGVRGQSYFVLSPGEADPKFRPIPAESRGRPPLFLSADDKGRIWGGPHFGQTLCYYDTKTSKAINTDAICDGGGEVYGVTFHEGLVYAASYAGGDITRYDPSKAWDQWNHKNPQPVASVAPKYIRPAAGIVTGHDGKLYAGWMAKYGTYGGAVSITDPKTGKTDLIENPLGSQAIASIAVDHRRVYVGTSLEANGLPHQKGQAHLGVLEAPTGKVLFDKTYQAASVTRIVVERTSGRVAFTVGSKLHVYDPETDSVVADPIAGLPAITASCIVEPGDGTLLTGCGKQICRLDLSHKTFSVVAEGPVPIQALTIGADGRIYFSHEADLYRTREPLSSVK